MLVREREREREKEREREIFLLVMLFILNMSSSLSSHYVEKNHVKDIEWKLSLLKY